MFANGIRCELTNILVVPGQMNLNLLSVDIITGKELDILKSGKTKDV